MKKWFKLLRKPSRLRQRDLWLTVIPALLWIVAVSARSSVIKPRCVSNPDSCSTASIPIIDRYALGKERDDADLFSFYTQNISGALALTVPAGWSGFLWATGAINPAAALIAIGTDIVLVAQTSFWNGLATETSHLLTQRPRPFVLADPKGQGGDPANYTSFYSGHTSFAATSTTALFLILLSRGAPLFLVITSAIASPLLILSTGLFRVLAGRHFVTDVVSGALAGILIALWIAKAHKTERKN